MHGRKPIARDVDDRATHFGDDSNRVMIVVKSSCWSQSHLALTILKPQSLLLIQSLPVLPPEPPRAEAEENTAQGGHGERLAPEHVQPGPFQ